MHTLNKTGLVPITIPPPKKKGLTTLTPKRRLTTPNLEKGSMSPQPLKGLSQPQPTPKGGKHSQPLKEAKKPPKLELCEKMVWAKIQQGSLLYPRILKCHLDLHKGTIG